MPKTKGLTPKQQAFVKHLVENPKDSATKAAKKAYNVTSYGAARSIASENLTKPNIMAYLHSQADKAEQSILEIADYAKEYGRTESGSKEQGASYASVALAAYRDVLDRIHGKATQRLETSNTSLSFSINLTGSEDQADPK